MAYNGILQVVIDKTSKKVLRFGFCDFENDGSFDNGNETIIKKYKVFEFEIYEKDWFWDGENFGYES